MNTFPRCLQAVTLLICLSFATPSDAMDTVSVTPNSGDPASVDPIFTKPTPSYIRCSHFVGIDSFILRKDFESDLLGGPNDIQIGVMVFGLVENRLKPGAFGQSTYGPAVSLGKIQKVSDDQIDKSVRPSDNQISLYQIPLVFLNRSKNRHLVGLKVFAYESDVFSKKLMGFEPGYAYTVDVGVDDFSYEGRIVDLKTLEYVSYGQYFSANVPEPTEMKQESFVSGRLAEVSRTNFSDIGVQDMDWFWHDLGVLSKNQIQVANLTFENSNIEVTARVYKYCGSSYM